MACGNPHCRCECSPATFPAFDISDFEVERTNAQIDELFGRRPLYLDPDFRLEHLARRLGHPVRRVSRAIIRGRGMSVPDFLNRLRVDAVRQRLAEPAETASVLDIALECGFASKATFNRAFNRHAGAPPSQVRAKLRRCHERSQIT